MLKKEDLVKKLTTPIEDVIKSEKEKCFLIIINIKLLDKQKDPKATTQKRDQLQFL